MDFAATIRNALNALKVNKLRATLTMLSIINDGVSAQATEPGPRKAGMRIKRAPTTPALFRSA
jgi:hypothetical protein